MKYKAWIRCTECTRVFEAFLSRHPNGVPFILEHGADFEMQFGVERKTEGRIYAECPYDDCQAHLMHFEWWETYRDRVIEKTPDPDVKYPEPV